MKLTTGRGNQFFKKPIFTVPKKFAVNTFKYLGSKLPKGLKKKGNK